MKLFMMTDLEGATGVAGQWNDFNPGGREHEAAKRYLTGDVNAAINGALEGGATDIVVLDGHGSVFSIILKDLSSKVQLIRGRRINELEGLDESYNLMFAIGTHSMAGTLDGMLTHTLSHHGIDNIWLNGQTVGEIGLWAAHAGYYSVPLGLVTGDLAAVKEAKALLGEIETVVVKEATSRFSAKCLHPKTTWKMISQAAETAIVRAEEFFPYKLEVPVELKVEYHDSEKADRVAKRKEVVRVDGRTVSCSGDNILEVYAVLLH